MRLHSAQAMAAVLLTAGALACNDATAPTRVSAVGTYSLQTVNGNGLPYTFNDGGYTVSIQSDTYTLSSDGTYQETTEETVAGGIQNTPETLTELGNWSQNNNAVTFQPTSNSQNNYAAYTGSLTGGGLGSGVALTISQAGVVAVYTRQ